MTEIDKYKAIVKLLLKVIRLTPGATKVLGQIILSDPKSAELYMELMEHTHG